MVHLLNKVSIFKELHCGLGDSGASSISEALKVNSSLTQLELRIEFIIECYWLIVNQSRSICNNIGDSGATSLSEALNVNSSLTQLNLGLSLILDMIDWLLFNHIPFGTILDHQEQHHYQKHWRLIHPSLNWIWEWVYYWIWLIDYYSITFHL